MGQITNTCILWSANIPRWCGKDLYLSSEISYKNKWGDDFDIFNVNDLITRSENSVRILQSNMVINIVATTLKDLYFSL